MRKLGIFVTGVASVAAMATATVMAVAPTRHPAARSAVVAPTAFLVDGGGGSAPSIGFGEPAPVAFAAAETVVEMVSTPPGTSQVLPTPAAATSPARIQTTRNASPGLALAPAGSSRAVAPTAPAPAPAPTTVRRASEAVASPAVPERSDDEHSAD